MSSSAGGATAEARAEQPPADAEERRQMRLQALCRLRRSQMYDALSDSARDLLASKRLKYIRSYGDREWQRIYQTDNLEAAARFASFEDGSRVPEDLVAEINPAQAARTIEIPMRSGDVVLLDHSRATHGRRAFRGDDRQRWRA